MDQQSKFNETPIWWKWWLWAFLVPPLTIFIILSTATTWPVLLTMAILGAVTVLGCSFYAAKHLTDSDLFIRRKAIVAAVLIETTLIINAICHGGGSRAYENALVGEHERHIEEDRAAAFRRQQTEDQIRLNLSESQRIESEGKAAKSEALRLDAETRRLRLSGGSVPRSFSPRPRSTPTESFSMASDLPADSKSESPHAVKIILLTPAEVLASWFWVIFAGFILESIAAVGGGLLVLRETLADRDRNGRPDWIDRLEANPLPPQLRAVESPHRAALRVKKSPPGGDAAPDYPDAGTAPETAPQGDFVEREGSRYWVIGGREFPDVEGCRYRGKSSKGVVEVWQNGGYLGQFGKLELARMDKLSAQEFESAVKTKIANWRSMGVDK